MANLFFLIWHDNLGTGWTCLLIVLLLLWILLSLLVIIYIKINKKNLTKKLLLLLIPFAILLSQLVPITYDFLAKTALFRNLNEAIELELKAIDSAIIPYQKGAYYCNLASLYSIKKDFNTAQKLYKKAFDYLGSYKYPCWGISFLHFYTFGEYDTAIEIIKNDEKLKNYYDFLAMCYAMKKDTENALMNVDKAIAKKKHYKNLALKANLIKSTNPDLATKYYKVALQICNKPEEKYIVNEIYNDFINYEKNRLETIKLKNNQY